MAFETERTILRAYEPSDAEKMLEHWNTLEIQDLAFIDYPAPRTKKFIEQCILGEMAQHCYGADITSYTNSSLAGITDCKWQQDTSQKDISPADICSDQLQADSHGCRVFCKVDVEN